LRSTHVTTVMPTCCASESTDESVNEGYFDDVVRISVDYLAWRRFEHRLHDQPP
jgi:hypothetical protein